MNYYVPDFEMEDDQHLISTSSTVTHHHKADDDILELLWQDGQVVAQPQPRKFQSSIALAPEHDYSQQQQQQQREQQLYMAEDEMATWLHYPIEDLYSDLICENPTSSLPPLSTTVCQSTLIRPPIPPPQLKIAEPSPSRQPPSKVPPLRQPPSKVVEPLWRLSSEVEVPSRQQPVTVVAPPKNFQMFSRMRGKGPEAGPDLTVVESNVTPAVGEVSSSGGGYNRVLETGGGSGEMTVSSSSGTSGGGGRPAYTCTTKDVLVTAISEDVGEKGNAGNRKRKQRGEIDESATTTPTTATIGEDVELDAVVEDKKHSRGLHSMKRTRAAEVHNLSERKRRDRINEKMKALQELIPRCNKSDKASMLDEVIEYLKSLQMQVQMMSMGCGMVPMMYPGMQQQFMPPPMGMGMNRPMMPFPSNVPGSNFPTTPTVGAGPQIAQNFNIQPVRMPPITAGSNLPVDQGHSVRSSFPVQTPVLPQQPNLGDPYQQYMALQQMQQMQMQQMQVQMQIQAVQNQSTSRPGSSKPSTSKSEGPPGPSTSKSEAEDDE